MNFLFPVIDRSHFFPMLRITLLGSLIAGFYGMLHDQVTYSISTEYFSKLKFGQFHYADFGWPVRIHVAKIGFLATWWVGAFSGWFLARIAVPAWSFPEALRKCLTGFLIIFGFVIVSGTIGGILGVCHSGDFSHWEEICSSLGIMDIRAFVRVAYIHNASYLGGLAGLVTAILYIIRERSLAGKPIRFKIFKSCS